MPRETLRVQPVYFRSHRPLSRKPGKRKRPFASLKLLLDYNSQLCPSWLGGLESQKGGSAQPEPCPSPASDQKGSEPKWLGPFPPGGLTSAVFPFACGRGRLTWWEAANGAPDIQEDLVVVFVVLTHFPTWGGGGKKYHVLVGSGSHTWTHMGTQEGAAWRLLAGTNSQVPAPEASCPVSQSSAVPDTPTHPNLTGKERGPPTPWRGLSRHALR